MAAAAMMPRPPLRTPRSPDTPSARRIRGRVHDEPTWLGFGDVMGGDPKACEGWVEDAEEAALLCLEAAVAEGNRERPPLGQSLRGQKRQFHQLEAAHARGLRVPPPENSNPPFGICYDGYTYELSSHAVHNKAALVMPPALYPKPPVPVDKDMGPAAGRKTVEVRRKYPAGVRGCARRRRDLRRRFAEGCPEEWMEALKPKLKWHRENEQYMVLYGEQGNQKLHPRLWEGKARPYPPAPDAPRIPDRPCKKRVDFDVSVRPQRVASQPLHCMLNFKDKWVTSAQAAQSEVAVPEPPKTPKPVRPRTAPRPATPIRPRSDRLALFPPHDPDDPSGWIPQRRPATARNHPSSQNALWDLKPPPRRCPSPVQVPYATRSPPPEPAPRRTRLRKLRCERRKRRELKVVDRRHTGEKVRNMIEAECAPGAGAHMGPCWSGRVMGA
eukprot:Hpha_TRINITY_DN18353_c0_g1::TRINITY_DN18353_c0_g1_i1::g.158339::m.158339